MNISISNIAWDPQADDKVAVILKRHNIQCIDIAPPKYFSAPSEATDSEIISIRELWKKKGVSIIGMQSLLFGTHGLNIFSNSDSQAAMLLHLSHICYIGNLLGARKLVFGSPRNRDRAHLDDIAAHDIACKFFNRLGDIAKQNSVVICLEPNPTCYNSNFMTNSLDTANVVNSINHSNIKMQLDVGAMLINNESPELIIPQINHLIGHVHISEPQLAPLNIDNDYHKAVAQLLHQYLPDKDITIEMLTSAENSSLNEIEKSIVFVKNIYGKKV